MVGILVLIVFVIVYTTWKNFHAVQRTDTKTLRDGKTYSYVIGDNLRLYGRGATYYGLGVVLPKSFPQLYLDSQRGGGRGARYAIDVSQRISLEGDFDASFQLYTPKGTQVLALSIITPDVMETLQSVAGDYDVELYRDQLHIISRKPVYRHPDRQAELIKIMERVLLEIDQKLPSWTKVYAPATEERLEMYPFRGVRVFGRFIAWQFFVLQIIWGLMTLLFVWMALILFFYYHKPRDGWWLLAFAGGLFVILSWLNHLAVKRERFRPYD